MKDKERRSNRARNSDELSRRAFRTSAALSCLIYLPAIAAVVLTTRAAGPDLFDLKPKVANADGYRLVAWHELERTRHSLREGGVSTGAPLRLLGYMTTGSERVLDGQIVARFTLQPDAGNLLHAAHRFGDQMIDVQLQAGDTVRFSEGSLVWVWGTLRAWPGDPAGHLALYELENARTGAADRAEIAKYFR
jgi:hypothetical protein